MARLRDVSMQRVGKPGMSSFYFLAEGEMTPAGWTGVSIPDRLVTGEADAAREYGVPTTLERDLLRLAASVFAVDRGVLRGEREQVSRRLDISVPVVNVARLLPLVERIESVLFRLSDDNWRVELRQAPGEPEEPAEGGRHGGGTLLFSGGLDSLAAALEFGAIPGGLQLVSHRTRGGSMITAQNRLRALLQAAGRSLPHRRFTVSSRSGVGLPRHDVEASQRTRSFVFLVVGGMAARRASHSDLLYLAENGQMAIHLPLTQGRLGALSTHTAHPAVLMEMEVILNLALGTNLRLRNPYVHRTKAEVVDVVVRQLPAGLRESNSCWRASRLPAPSTHCGACVPCFVRRVAIEHHGLDPTPYARDVLREDIARLGGDDDGRRNLLDLLEFTKRIEVSDAQSLMDEYPELYSRGVDAAETIRMYKRFAVEALNVWRRYPSIAGILA